PRRGRTAPGAGARAWPSIAAHSLLTAAEIVSTMGLSAEEQARILGRPRPGRLAVSHPPAGHGGPPRPNAAPSTHPGEIAAPPERGGVARPSQRPCVLLA